MAPARKARARIIPHIHASAEEMHRQNSESNLAKIEGGPWTYPAQYHARMTAESRGRDLSEVERRCPMSGGGRSSGAHIMKLAWRDLVSLLRRNPEHGPMTPRPRLTSDKDDDRPWTTSS